MYFNLLISKKKDINIRLETNEKELFFQFDEHYLSEVINNLLTKNSLLIDNRLFY